MPGEVVMYIDDDNRLGTPPNDESDHGMIHKDSPNQSQSPSPLTQSDSSITSVNSLPDGLNHCNDPRKSFHSVLDQPQLQSFNSAQESPSGPWMSPAVDQEDRGSGRIGNYQRRRSSSRQNGKDDGDGVYNKTTEPLINEERCNVKGMLGKPFRKLSRTKLISETFSSSSVGNSYDRRHWCILIILCVATLTSSFAVCLFPPFFPRIAEEKGASATIYGFIIGTNCLTAFLVTPIIGKKLEDIGVKFAFVAGLLCSGGCCLLSGFLEFFPPGFEFVISAIFIRIVHATANAGVSTATFAFIAVEFPESVAKLFALTRTTMNLAQMFGPVVGGALYEVGGFKMPFLVMGSIQMLMSLFALALLPPYIAEKDSKGESRKCDISLWSIFAVPGIWVSFLTFIFSTMSNGFLSITLEPLVLRKFNLSPFYVGLLFGLKDGANSLASPFWGYLCDKYYKVKIFIFLGSCLAFTSFILIGPFPGIPLEQSLGIVIAALILNGFGIGGQQVSGVVDSMREAVAAGFPDEAGTHGFVAGLWSSLSGAGRFISRGGSGLLVDTIGFRETSAIVVGLHGAIMAICMIYCIFTSGKLLRCSSKDPQRSLTPRRNTICPADMVFDTSPSEPVTTKVVNIRFPSVREAIEDSLVSGSAPIPTSTKYARRSRFVSEALR
ncbi:unnamed protein product [Meganyctiphanes norvegica]|uniref:Major facilitator superfamily (MFS) profile domain-containing protein n=1 Tax=Meganyctiphanes norvegica TaxID=48144 RepID=A0AAV2PQS4_MEGNR